MHGAREGEPLPEERHDWVDDVSELEEELNVDEGTIERSHCLINHVVRCVNLSRRHNYVFTDKHVTSLCALS